MTKFPVMDGSQPIIKLVNAYLNGYTQQRRFAGYSLRNDRVARLLRFADELLADVARGVYEYECTRYDVPKDKSNG